jgi:pimeloyl-ACP methyl ester carboxylesterase
MLPDFNEQGVLPPGVWRSSGKEFLQRFVNGESRDKFCKTILNILDFAAHHYAVSVLVGGSFVTDKSDPADFDCVILFKTKDRIPHRRESLDIDGRSIDVFFASQDNPLLVRSFLRLFSTSQFEEKVGVVEIELRNNDAPVWDITWEVDDDLFEIVKRAYIDRYFVDRIERQKVLVTIHGLHSHAEWNADVTLIASANGWIVAPFHYGFVHATVLASQKARQEIVDRFREYLHDLQMMLGISTVSVLAHSFGTYIACKYLLGFDHPPTVADTLILTGAIVDEKLDLARFAGKAACIVNEVAPNDEWAEWAKVANLGRDELLGRAGKLGFTSTDERLIQSRSEIFTHTNVIRRDVVYQRWMPILEANFGAGSREAMKLLMRQFEG